MVLLDNSNVFCHREISLLAFIIGNGVPSGIVFAVNASDTVCNFKKSEHHGFAFLVLLPNCT